MITRASAIVSMMTEDQVRMNRLESGGRANTSSPNCHRGAAPAVPSEPSDSLALSSALLFVAELSRCRSRPSGDEHAADMQRTRCRAVKEVSEQRARASQALRFLATLAVLLMQTHGATACSNGTTGCDEPVTTTATDTTTTTPSPLMQTHGATASSNGTMVAAGEYHACAILVPMPHIPWIHRHHAMGVCLPPSPVALVHLPRQEPSVLVHCLEKGRYASEMPIR